MARKCSPPVFRFTSSHSRASCVSSLVCRNRAYCQLSATPVSRMSVPMSRSTEMPPSSRPLVQPASAAARLVYTAMPGTSVSSGRFGSISSTSPNTLFFFTCSISSRTPTSGSATNAQLSPRSASGSGRGELFSKPIMGEAWPSNPGCCLYTFSTRQSSHVVRVWHRREGSGSTPASLHARVMMVCICERKNLNRRGRAPCAAITRSIALESSTELMRLLGKYSACSNDRVSSQMSSSHIFFPRSSFIGREQKSSCQSYGKSTISPEGAPV
mmetsp:Transcript_4507/g.17996  ORF Transcript_4507/g.17996 Transcript_4507/m.17996 type:complete len:271 (+) Transcript_4507:192-1004(+)